MRGVRWGRLDDAGGETYLTELIAAVPTAVHVEYYGRIVERTATLRRLISAGTEIVDIGYTEALDIEQALDGADAIDRLRGFAYDGLVVDLRLPDANGMDVLDEALTLFPAIRAARLPVAQALREL